MLRMEGDGPVREQFQAPLEIYLELQEAVPTDRGGILRRIATDNPDKALALPALTKIKIDELLEAYETREIGELKTRLRDAILEQEQELENRSPEDTEAYMKFIDDPTMSSYVPDLDSLGLGYKLRANLREANLEYIHLEGADLTGADLREARLKGAYLKGASLNQAWLTKTKLYNATLQRAGLVGANLGEATLTGAKLEGVSLIGAKLKNAELIGANLTGKDTRLENADLSEADLSRAELQNLTDINLKGSLKDKEEFERTNEIAKSVGEDLKSRLENDIPQEICREYEGPLERLLNELDERLGKIEAATKGAIFRKACFRDARLEGTDLSPCDLGGAYIGNARLDRTRMKKELIEEGTGEETEATNPDQVGFLDKDEYVQEKLKSYNNKSLGKRLLFYEAAKDSYKNLKQNFASLGEDEASSRAYLRERRMERLEAWYGAGSAWAEGKGCPPVQLKGTVIRGGKWVMDLAARWLCDYGENPWLVVLLWIPLVFLLFAALYGVTGISTTDGNTAYICNSFENCWNHLEIFSLFSLGSMVTMDPQGLQPSCPLVEFASRAEALLAIALTGLFGFALGNLLRRR